MLNIAFISGGKNIPSETYRLKVLSDYLYRHDVRLFEFSSITSKYPPESILFRPLWFFAALAERASYIVRLKGFKALILQRELISTLPTIEKALLIPKILDVDDAIYLYKKGLAAKNSAEASVGVICGNEFLAEKFTKWNKNIEIIPTGVDVRRMNPVGNRFSTEQRIIGWIGTPSNLKFLDMIADSLVYVLTQMKNVELRIVTDQKDAIPSRLKPFATFVRWHQGIEFIEVPTWTVGIMPLQDTEWARGKCAFKMLQYFSAGIPVVTSPVGMNKNILDSEDVGFLAKNSKEWIDALTYILSHEKENNLLGRKAREFVELNFDLDIVAKKWINVLERWL